MARCVPSPRRAVSPSGCAISVTERQRYILRVRTLSRAVAQAYYAQREKLGFPGLRHAAVEAAEKLA